MADRSKGGKEGRNLPSVEVLFDEREAKRKETLVRKGFLTKIRRYASRIPFAKDAVSLYLFVTDRSKPFLERSAGIIALAYFISPIDAIPDLLPFLGFVDDAAIVSMVIAYYGKRIRPYRGNAELLLREIERKAREGQ